MTIIHLSVADRLLQCFTDKHKLKSLKYTKKLQWFCVIFHVNA
jgi:hypothetical protein